MDHPFTKILLLPLVWGSAGAFTSTASAAEWKELFNGKDLGGWTPLIEKTPHGEDPEKYIVVRDGEIRMYADTPEDKKVNFGSIISKESFSRFVFSFEYRWGEARFAPRKDTLRDAGMLYHVPAAEMKVYGAWPISLECQVQEGDTGDIMCLETGSLSWRAPDPRKAPEGQGDPGMLPEEGGVPMACGPGKYVGRYPVADKLQGWNQVEVIVQADETAIHKVNGVVRARLSLLSDAKGNPLDRGMIGLQLEGARIDYRNLRLKELPAPLQVTPYASLSAVRDISKGTLEVLVKNPGGNPLPLQARLVGKDAASFSIGQLPESIAAGGEIKLTLGFQPTGKAGRYSAGLQLGPEDTGAFVVLQGLATDALEGENEPPLERIVRSLGIPLDVGGSALTLGTDAPTVGQSKPAKKFGKAGDGPVKITPLARYSPPGEVPFGWNADKEQIAGTLVDSKGKPDAHQCVFPPLTTGKPAVEIDPGQKAFSLFIHTEKIHVGTDKEKYPSKLANPTRVYPVSSVMGRRVSNAFLVCFEEASNGDYQDCVFLVENLRIDGNP